MLDDPEFIGLCQTPEGREAYALFTALLMAAKDQDNGGKFTQDSAVLAMMVRWPLDAFRKALAILQDKTNWLIVDASLVQIRSYKKWNSWGGNRDGAGRPIKTNSSDNQDAQLAESKSDVLAVVVDVVPKNKGTTAARNFRADFLSLYPESPNTRYSPQAERDWFALTDKQVEQCKAAIQIYAAEVALWPKVERKYVLKPENFINGYGPEFKVSAETFKREADGTGQTKGVAGRAFEARASQGDKFAKLDGRA